ncbi:hypothetical protein ILYODFUR_006629 [Ilyodon furcidens]|uniref:Uncharacterized protein n=1 Tax=Ilyodon furcidens TaxID=33524 RepID=A0ABV0U679_9TELE
MGYPTDVDTGCYGSRSWRWRNAVKDLQIAVSAPGGFLPRETPAKDLIVGSSRQPQSAICWGIVWLDRPEFLSQTGSKVSPPVAAPYLPWPVPPFHFHRPGETEAQTIETSHHATVETLRDER